MAKVTWTPQAWDELAEINDRISQYSEQHADFIVNRILYFANHLETFPRLGRVVPEANIKALREVIVDKYRILYFLPQTDEVQILTIRHSSRALPDTILPG
jgi:toxin ParE1/3/4